MVRPGASELEAVAAFEPPQGLAQVVAAGPEHWSLERRPCQARDLGHPCRGCGAPLTEVGAFLFIWKAATFVKRFHPECAACFDGGEASAPSTPSYSGLDAEGADVALVGYADAWRRSQLSDRAVRRTAERQAAWNAARRWPQYPTAGMLWRAGTLALQQERKDAEGVTAWKRQMAALQSFTQDSCAVWRPLGPAEGLECAICLADVTPEAGEGRGQGFLLLPCDPSHAFHTACLEPWLRVNFRCPKCRADLRPLLNPEVRQTVVNSIRSCRAGGACRVPAKGGPSMGRRSTAVKARG